MSVDEVFEAVRALSPDERVILRHALLEEMEKEVQRCVAETGDEFITVEGSRPSDDSDKESS